MMWKRLVQTTNDGALSLLRVALGVVMFAHGAQKLLGWFGGYGVAGTTGFFQQALGIPFAVAMLVIVAEFFGSLGLIFGFLTRLSAAGIAAVLLGAVYFVHGQVGFFMNWTGTASGEGFEFHILAIAIAAALAVRGGGALSVDRWLARFVRTDQASGGPGRVALDRAA